MAQTMVNIDEEDVKFPININKDLAEVISFEKEVMVEILRQVHGRESKKEAIEKIRETYESISATQLKKKIDEISVQAVFVNKDVFEKLNLPIDEYFSSQEKIFAEKKGNNSIKENSQNGSVDGGNQLNQNGTNNINSGTKKENAVAPKKLKIDKNLINTDKEAQRLFAKKIHGLQKSIATTSNPIYAEMIKEYPQCSKDSMKTKAMQISRQGWIISKDLFVENEIEDEFVNLFQARFVGEKEQSIYSKKKSSTGKMSIEKPENNKINTISRCITLEQIRREMESENCPDKTQSSRVMSDNKKIEKSETKNIEKSETKNRLVQSLFFHNCLYYCFFLFILLFYIFLLLFFCLHYCFKLRMYKVPENFQLLLRLR